MKLTETNISGVFLIDNFFAQDERGYFSKLYHIDLFSGYGIESTFKEGFFSYSKKGVIRGLHFQLPPFDHSKLVFVTEGEITDVVLDLRKNSPTFKKASSFTLSAGKNSIFIPTGCAHGFAASSGSAIVVYLTSTVHNKEADTGIKWNSIDFDWKIENPIVSERDNSFIELKKFESPF